MRPSIIVENKTLAPGMEKIYNVCVENQTQSELVTIREAAALRGKTVQSVRALIEKGRFEVVHRKTRYGSVQCLIRRQVEEYREHRRGRRPGEVQG